MPVHIEDKELSRGITNFSVQSVSTEKKIHKFAIEMFTLHIFMILTFGNIRYSTYVFLA